MSIDTLFEVDERHPMWHHVPNPIMQRHREVVLRALSIELLRFDDNTVKDADIVRWCREVHDLVSVANATEMTRTPAWLVGAIELSRIRRVTGMRKRLDTNAGLHTPIQREQARRTINVITDLCERFVQAIAKECS